MSSSLHILYIDDDTDDRDHVQRELTRAFHRVRIDWIADADAQVRALEAGGFDAVVTDFVLGWTNGLSILREIKVRHPDCPVIMFTAGGNESVAVEGMKAGLDDYVIRSPAQRARLAPAIQAALERARARAAAREAEAKYRHLYAGVPVGLFRAAPDGRLLEANPAFLQMLGCLADASLQGRPFDSLFVDLTEHAQLTAALARDGVVRGFEARLRRRDGAIIGVRGSVRAVRAGDGPAPYWEGELEDVTERRKAEEALRENRARLEMALDAGRMSAWDLDLDTRRITWHRGAEMLFGLSPGGFAGSEAAFLERVHPDDRERIQRAMGEAVATGRPYQADFRVVWPDGSVHWVSASGQVQRDAAGKPLRVVGMGFDVTERRLADETIKSSEERFRQIAGVIREVFWLAPADGSGFLYVSPSYEDVWGRSCESLYADPAGWIETVLPEDRSRLDRAAAARAPGTSDVVYRILRPDGTIRWIRDRAFPVRDEHGEAYRIAGIAEDVTEHHLSEEALRASEAELRSLVAAMTDVILLLDADGRYLKIISNDPSRLVKPAPEMLGKTIHEVFPRERADFFLGDIRRVLSTRQPVVREFSLPVGGVERWVLATLSPVGEGTALLVARDITDRRRAEQALQESEEKYRKLIESANDAIFVADASTGLILDANRKASELLGLPLDRIVGSHQGTLHPPEEADRARRRFEDAVRRGMTTVSDLSLRGTGGRRIPVEISASVMEMGGHRVLQGIFRDVSERRQLEEQLRQTQKIEAIGRLAGGVAHDFNNLLSAIIGFGQLARQLADPATPLRRYVDEVLRAAERAATLTRQLLVFSRRQVLKPALLDMGVVVEAMGGMVRRLIGEDIRCQVVSPPGLGWVRADVGQVEQVILNLAVNARDAMPRGGTLNLETARVTLDAESAARVPEGRPGDFILLRVSDAGCGMDAETRAHIFEPFFTTKEHGTGLGLSTAYGIIRQSGGFIGVESEPGRGSTFCVFLPRVDDPESKPASGVFPAVLPEGNETVLLVEDEEVVRAVAREILQGRGYTVLEAADADEGLEAAAGHDGPIHLLLSDVGLPGISGPELARRLAAQRPGLRLLFMTGYTDERLGEEAVFVGGLLLRKPFTQATLARRVREVLDGPPPAGPAPKERP
jgi:two-component system, cell cycle sensor histidine kinase and response regulator CckA